MKDSTARLAARLARETGRVHPLDWVEVYESHTPYEWLVQECLAIVDPWGDDRDDMRAAINTMAALPAGDYDRDEVRDALVAYLKINEREQVLGPDAIRAAIEG